jgi:hypothetical protein
MRYTLWLNGHLLGATRLEHKGPNPGQQLGGLSPTAHGLEMLPSLCGFLGTASAMKRSMSERGVPDPDRDVDRTMELLETTPEGMRFTALVKVLGQLELRESGGEIAPFHTVIVTDLHELGAITQSLNVEEQLAEGAPRYIISATRTSFRTVTSILRGPSARMRIRLEPN